MEGPRPKLPAGWDEIRPELPAGWDEIKPDCPACGRSVDDTHEKISERVCNLKNCRQAFKVHEDCERYDRMYCWDHRDEMCFKCRGHLGAKPKSVICSTCCSIASFRDVKSAKAALCEKKVDRVEWILKFIERVKAYQVTSEDWLMLESVEELRDGFTCGKIEKSFWPSLAVFWYPFHGTGTFFKDGKIPWYPDRIWMNRRLMKVLRLDESSHKHDDKTECDYLRSTFEVLELKVPKLGPETSALKYVLSMAYIHYRLRVCKFVTDEDLKSMRKRIYGALDSVQKNEKTELRRILKTEIERICGK